MILYTSAQWTSLYSDFPFLVSPNGLNSVITCLCPTVHVEGTQGRCLAFGRGGDTPGPEGQPTTLHPESLASELAVLTGWLFRADSPGKSEGILPRGRRVDTW